MQSVSPGAEILLDSPQVLFPARIFSFQCTRTQGIISFDDCTVLRSRKLIIPHNQTMAVFRLLPDPFVFPPPELADPSGLLAVGGDLSVERILTGYRQGIFPWYTADQPILWWSPDPRLVLFPEEFHLPRRLARTVRQQVFTVTADQAFEKVMEQCATVRLAQGEQTWITPEMLEAYVKLHQLGYAHSIECWQEGKLAGGLYGLCLDRVFFGESMFSRQRDSSKVALVFLVRLASTIGIRLIDCQVVSSHLQRFGARAISGARFRSYLDQFIVRDKPQEKWRLQ